jgi:hypothetical protein
LMFGFASLFRRWFCFAEVQPSLFVFHYQYRLWAVIYSFV